MHMIYMYVIAATVTISLLSLVGVFTLSLKKALLQRFILFLVALSAGTMLGSTFFHLMPESIEYLRADTAFQLTFVSLVVFFLIEKVLHWHHCHRADCHTHSIGYMNIVGDALHNFIDGMIIATTFVVSIPLGIATTIAIAAHEIPQEIGDFGVLLHAGFSVKKALLFNVLSAGMAVVGALISLVLFESIDSFQHYLLPLAAGGFLYIGATDLLPELRKESNRTKLIGLVMMFLLGAGLMFALQQITPHSHAEESHGHDEEIHSEIQPEIQEVSPNEIKVKDTHADPDHADEDVH